MEVLLYLGVPTKNEHDEFSCPQKFIAYPQPHEILKCRFFYGYLKNYNFIKFELSITKKNSSDDFRVFDNYDFLIIQCVHVIAKRAIYTLNERERKNEEDYTSEYIC